ncbi:serine protease [Streptomyces polygonati]|uniref:Serine protease n=1 Tax=Streptomyces polygonati TaxID=1617087 RepID=A0ABV8HIB1_9ACTN
MPARASERDGALIRVCDLAGRPRGTGFLADADGTMITSHEAVDGLARLVLHAPGDQVCLVEAGAITPLPEYGLALVATEGLSLPALPVATGGPAHPDRRIRLRLPHRAEGTVLGTTAVTYVATDRFHLLDEVYELDLDGADLNRAAAHASGAPLIDAATGAVLAVVVTALHAGHRASGFAAPLRAGGGSAPLSALLARNAATVPAYGPHLNLAGALRLTDTTPGPAAGPSDVPVARPELAHALAEFPAAPGESAPLVLGLVGDPGTGRSTELARLAARRARGERPAPTVWLRGAELRPGDGGIEDAVDRSLRAAARTVRAASGAASGGAAAEPPHTSPHALAEVTRSAGRPLLVILDGPEEMPPVLAHGLGDWTAATADWLRTCGARLIVACRPEFWEQVEVRLPDEAARRLPIGELTGEQALRARARFGLPDDSLTAADAAHPLALRLLADVRAALPDGADPGAAPSRAEIFAAHLDLICLRVAERLAALSQPQIRGTGLRRLAARVAGQAHEAARRCLGPGQGQLDRDAFEELFPWRTGWAAAVLAEGLLVPAGAGYRFAHEEFADWLQSLHLDLDMALHALVHRWFTPSGALPEAPVRLPSRAATRPSCAATRAGQPPPVPAAPPIAPAAYPRGLPVPRHRAGPVRQALLAAPPAARTARLLALLHTLDHHTPPPTRLLPPTPSPEATDPEADTLPIPHPARSGRRGGGRTAGAGVAESPGPAEQRADVVPVPQPARMWRRGAGRTETARVAEARMPVESTSLPEGRADAVPTAYPARGGGRGGRWSAGAVESRQPVESPGLAERRADAVWWATHLVVRTLSAAPDTDVLRELAGRIVVRAVERGGFTPTAMGALGHFGPAFWCSLPLPVTERLELLRLLVPADGPPAAVPAADRFLIAAAGLLRARPAEAVPALCGWFGDDRPLRTGAATEAPGRRPAEQEPARPGAATAPLTAAAPPLTVACAAQALLHTHRRLAVDDLTEALVAVGHPAADELLAALAEDEAPAVCRAADRWAGDERPDRRVAAATYGLRAAPHVRSAADRELLRRAALAILARPADSALHGAALGMLVLDPSAREGHLPAALRRFTGGDAHLTPSVVGAALGTHPEAVLTAFGTRLRDAAHSPPEAAAGITAGILHALSAVASPALARRAATLVEEDLRHRPAAAPEVARFLDARLEQGPGARAVLLPLVTALLRDHSAEVRSALVPVFAAAGTPLSRPLRQELLDHALDAERDPVVLDALLTAAADGCRERRPQQTRELVHRLGLLLGRTPEGAAHFDRRVVELAATEPDFARLLRQWLTDGGSWDAVVGPCARRRIDTVA